MPEKKLFINNTEINPINTEDLFNYIRKAIHGNSTLHLISSNLQHIGLYQQFGRHYHRYEKLRNGKNVLTLIDGRPILSKVNRKLQSNYPLLTGSDLLPKLLAKFNDEEVGLSVAFVGGDSTMLQALQTKLSSLYPNLSFSFYNPSRIELGDEKYLKWLKNEFKQLGIKVVFLNLPKPISDFLALEHFNTKNIKMTASFGAAADFLANYKKRAPKLMQFFHAEWLYRLMKEPKRLFKRYIVEGPKEYYLLHFKLSTHKKLLTPQVLRNYISKKLFVLDTLAILLSSIFAAKSRHYLENSLTWYTPNYTQVLAMGLIILFISFLFRSRTPISLRIESELYLNAFIAAIVSISFIGFVSYLFILHISRGYLILLLLYLVLMLFIVRLLFSIYLNNKRSRGELLTYVGLSPSVPLDHPFLGYIKKSTSFGYLVEDKNITLREARENYLGVVVTSEEDTDFLDHHKYFIGAKPEIILLPKSLSLAPHRIAAETFGVNSIFHLLPLNFSIRNKIIKRFTDIIFSLLFLILFSPLLLLVALLIKFKDKGPVFFIQKRVGKDNIEFNIYKFRTMVPNAESLLEQLRNENEGGEILFKIKHDPRITKIGYYLRKLSIDELPQLFNVLKGDMSLVGPRPALSHEVRLYDDFSMLRHMLRPGITGLWQVSGRSNIKDYEALALDLHYVSNWSLYQDILILFKTIKAVFSSDGAY